MDGKIIKDIQFLDQGVSYHYQEKVQALTLKDFEFLLGKIGFNLLDVFGAYDLSPFNEVASDRLVIIAQNTHAR